jgi:hypothetical protein
LLVITSSWLRSLSVSATNAFDSTSFLCTLASSFAFHFASSLGVAWSASPFLISTLIANPSATSADTFPVIYSNEALGGTHSYSTIYDRNNIPLERRKEGMFVNVTGSTYILSGGLDNSNWVYLPLNINSFGTGTTLFVKNEATGQNYIKTLSTKSPVLSITESNGVIFVDFLGGSGSANLSNDPYNYTTWISDGITGATRQAIAAKFNLNDTNITNLKNSLTGYTATTLNLINIKLDISDFNNYSANTLNNINTRLLISDFVNAGI